jgi:hypothetical protein
MIGWEKHQKTNHKNQINIKFEIRKGAKKELTYHILLCARCVKHDEVKHQETNHKIQINIKSEIGM